jgi:hypothetical protein
MNYLQNYHVIWFSKKLVRSVGTQRVWTDVQFSFCRIAFVKCKVLQIKSKFGNLSLLGGFKAPWCNIQSMVSQCVEQWNPFLPEGTPPVKSFSLLTPISGLIFPTLPTHVDHSVVDARKEALKIVDNLLPLTRHGSIREAEGEKESMVSPFAGDMKHPWGPFFPAGNPTSQM